MSEFGRKEYHIKSLFYDSPDLSTIQEECYDSSTAASPPLSLESHGSYFPCPPPAHCNGLWSPLPPLTIEIVKTQNKHDEPEEFYKRLHRKILKIYRRIFFEDRSDISDINTSGDDDEQTEPIDYSTNSVEVIELTHQSINDTSNDDNTSNNHEPIDYSTNRVELIKSTSQSVNNIPADEENHENITTAGTENQRSNEEIELQVNEPLDDEKHDDNVDNNDVDNNYCYLPNLETIFEYEDDDLSNLEASEDNPLTFEANVESDRDDLPNVEPDDSNIPNLEANIESDVGCVSSISDVMPNSTESDESRDSVTPLSSTMVHSRGTSDEEICLEKNEVSANTTHHILPEAQEMEEGRTSTQLLTGSVPRDGANPDEDVNMKIVMEADNEDIEETEASGPHERIPETHEGTPEHHEITPEGHGGTPNKNMGDNISMDTDSNLQNEVEEMRTPRPHRSIGSPTFNQNKKHLNKPELVIVEHYASMESEKYSQYEEETHRRPNTIEDPDNLDLFDLIRMSSPKEMREGNTRIINPDEYTANMSCEENSGDIALEENAVDVPPEDNSGRNSPGSDSRKRKSVSPYPSRGKKVRFAHKSVQTDDLIITKIVQNIDININSEDKKYTQINHLDRTVVQNIKININPSITV